MPDIPVTVETISALEKRVAQLEAALAAYTAATEARLKALETMAAKASAAAPSLFPWDK